MDKQRELDAEEGMSEFVEAAGRLASATTDVIPLLKRFGKQRETAKIVRTAGALVTALKKRPNLPRHGEHDAAWVVQRRLEQIQTQISNGALPPDEDLRERRDFWNFMLAQLRTREGHARFTEVVESLLSGERIPEKETRLLDAFSHESAREELLLELEPIRWAKGTDQVSVCRRWKDLVGLGLRRFSHRGDRPDGQQAICFKDLLLTRSLAGQRKGPLPLELEWAELLRGCTENLRPLAEAAGFDAGARMRISKMVQEVDAIRAGQPIDLSESVAAVQLLVDEILAQARRSPRAKVDRLHQLVNGLRGGMEHLLGIICPNSLGHDLMLLDHYVSTCEAGDHSPGPGKQNDVEWQWLTASLLAQQREATDLWHQEPGEPARSLLHEFVLAGNAKAEIAMLRDNSFHGLVLAVAALVLVPESLPTKHPDLLKKIVSGSEGVLPLGVVRRRFVQQLMQTSWPDETARELEREHVRVLQSLREGTARPTAPASGSGKDDDVGQESRKAPDATPNSVRVKATGARRSTQATRRREARARRKTEQQRRELSNMAILVLRALPSSSSPAMRTLAAIATKINTSPRPGISSVSRAVKELRVRSRPLVDTRSYRTTKAGDRERAKHQ